jgi:hypothetical protein
MLTLLGSVLGFGTSFLPKVMEYFQDKQDKAHELAMMDKQMVLQEKLHDQKLEMVATDAQIRDMESVRKHDKNTKIPFIDGLRGSVRPVVTYMFMLLFVAVEVAALVALLQEGRSMVEALPAIWSEEVLAMWAAILSFWFGGRQFGRVRK